MKAEEQLPEDRRAEFRKAVRETWVSIIYLISGVVLVALVMGRSQALKTELVGEALGLIPPILFLVSARIAARRPTRDFPYGYTAGTSAAYLGASTALLAVGLFLFLDGAGKLIRMEHPTIGGVKVFGHVIWLGWLALPVLAWSAIPAYFIGRTKLKLAERLHDKVLLAAAKTHAADWQSAAAAAVGIVGVGFGLWWADALAAVLISFEIIRDGLSNLKSATSDLLARRPQTLKSQENDPLPAELSRFLQGLPWVEDAVVRVREEGRTFLADAHVVPRDETGLVARIAQASEDARALDWRVAEVVITPVARLPEEIHRVRPDRDNEEGNQLPASRG